MGRLKAAICATLTITGRVRSFLLFHNYVVRTSSLNDKHSCQLFCYPTRAYVSRGYVIGSGVHIYMFVDEKYI